MILPATWPFPSQIKQDAATDQRAARRGKQTRMPMAVEGSLAISQVVHESAKGNPKARVATRRRPPILDDVQDAPY